MNELVKCIQTMKLVDVLECYPNMLDDLVLNTDENTQKFKDMFVAYWGFHESAFDTTDLFIRRIHDYYDVHKDFYINMLNVYQQEVNALDGYTETETGDSLTEDLRDEDSTIHSTSSNDSENSLYDLPNANNSGLGYKTNANEITSEGENNTTKNYSTDNKVNRDYRRNFKRVNVIEQRELYYKTMKNVMLEFVKKFSPCFLMIYM